MPLANPQIELIGVRKEFGGGQTRPTRSSPWRVPT